MSDPFKSHPFLSLEFKKVVAELDRQIHCGEWEDAHKQPHFRSRQLHALLLYVMKENADLKRRLESLENRHVPTDH
jgi:hypothetical protein